MSNETDPKLPDLSYIRELAGIFQDHELDELEIETGETRMLLRRSDMPAVAQPSAPLAAPAPAPAAPAGPAAAAAPAAAPAERPGDFITSPFVGTFYRSPRPDAPSFVEVGAKVQPGTTVCIVEAMKLFNEIEADFACTIEEVLVEDGQPVEYGAKLFRVTKQ
ncbi:MAG: acetyl-CoA carboxylase biotin carboxyl carrier protein [Nannocystaceae bacterium]|nr:acetyl-CoA carboxylase biotin carboxyl carrier protein [bacterium]